MLHQVADADQTPGLEISLISDSFPTSSLVGTSSQMVISTRRSAASKPKALFLFG
jgi:hypothetical protein